MISKDLRSHSERRESMAEEIQRVRGCAMNPARADKIDQTAQKVAQLLAESKATFEDVDLIFSRSKLYIVSTV